MILGLVLFLGVHTFHHTQRELCADRLDRLNGRGASTRPVMRWSRSAGPRADRPGGFAHYRSEGLIELWTPPRAFKNTSRWRLMLPAVILVVAAYIRGRIYTAVKHPMLSGVKLWGGGRI